MKEKQELKMELSTKKNCWVKEKCNFSGKEIRRNDSRKMHSKLESVEKENSRLLVNASITEK